MTPPPPPPPTPATSADPPALEVQDLSFGYASGDDVLKRVSLRLGAGQVCCVHGPSGAGKSTLLRLIAGLERPSGGRIDIAGERVFGGKTSVRPERRRIGFVFQDFQLFPHLSVLRNVTFGMRGMTKPERVVIADTMLDELGILETRDRGPLTLSGGQQQRVAIARALVRRPALLLLDEPLSSLDEASKLDAARLIETVLQRHRIATVVVSHDKQIENLTVDRRVKLNRGYLEHELAAQRGVSE